MIVGLCLLHVPINSNWRNGMVWLTFSFSFHFLYILWYSICPYIMNSCDRCVELNIRRGYMIPHSRFWAPVPDRYRHASDRIVPFPISRITDFVFPTELSRFRFRIKIWKRKWLGYFSDRSRPLSSLSSGIAKPQTNYDKWSPFLLWSYGTLLFRCNNNMYVSDFYLTLWSWELSSQQMLELFSIILYLSL